MTFPKSHGSVLVFNGHNVSLDQTIIKKKKSIACKTILITKGHKNLWLIKRFYEKKKKRKLNFIL